MNTYEAIWVLQEGTVHKETFVADGYELVHPNVVMFYKLQQKRITEVSLVPAAPANKEGPPVSVIGTAAGFVAVHMVKER